MIFILTNLFIFLSFYTLITKFRIPTLSGKLVCIITLFSAQIVLTELILGLTGMLYLHWLILLNVLISSFFIIIGLRGNSTLYLNFQKDTKHCKDWMKEVISPENIFMSILTLLALLWLTLAAYLLPPRSADDIAYHLPSIYEYATSHRIYLLPLELRPHFAMPQNAELLFMWPIMFFHSTTPVGIVQIIIIMGGEVALYALSQTLNIEKRIALFVTLLFLFTPAVLDIAGSGYIDIITATFYLICLYLSIMFYSKKDTCYLYCAAVAMGLTVGMKYPMLLFVSSLQILIIPALLKKKNIKKILVFITLILLLGGYWYLRNFSVLKNPFYPIGLSSSPGVFSSPITFNLWQKSKEIPLKLYQLVWEDIGFEYLGGLGLIFWGVCFPAWLYIFLKSIKTRTEGLGTIFLWGQLLIGLMIILILSPRGEFVFSPRYIIFIVPIGLLALGKVILLFKERKGYRAVIIFLCCFLSVITVLKIGNINNMPSFNVIIPIQDILTKRITVKNRYLEESTFMTQLYYTWEALDLLTKDDPKGLDCYMAVTQGFFNTAPTYGSRLQNRIWNFKTDFSAEPDAYIFDFGRTNKLFYLKKRVSIVTVLFNPRYELIVYTGDSFFFIKKDYLDKSNKSALLVNFYYNNFENEIKFLKDTVLNILEPGIPILTSREYGHALKYLQLTNNIRNTVLLMPADISANFAQKKHWQKAYSTDQPLKGFNSKIIFKSRAPKLSIFLNTK